MARKDKLSMKRAIENLKDVTSKVFEAPEITISKAKRRKHVNGEIINLENHEIFDSQLQNHNPVVSALSRQDSDNKCSQVEQRKKTSSVIGASCKERNLRNRFKKTYAFMSRTGSNQVRTKKNLDTNSEVLLKISNDIELRRPVENNEREGQKITTESEDRILSVPNNMQVINGDEGNDQQKYSITQIINSNNDLKTEKGCILYVQSPSLPDNKTLRTKTDKSCPSLIVGEHHQIVDSEISKEKFKTTGSVISTVTVSCVSHSHIPVLQPAIKVAEVPATPSMTSLSASTSAITAISTPIPAFPMLPDVFGETSHSGVDTHGTKTSVDKKEYGCLPSTSSQQVDVPHPACAEGHKQHHIILESCDKTVNDEEEIVSPMKRSHPCKDIPVPIVSTSDIGGSLSVKEQNSAVNKSYSRTSLHPPKLIKSSISPQQPSVLKVDTWAAYMLQNFELLYKNEKNCDLMLKFYGGEVLKVHRTILLAFTSLLSGLDVVEGRSELLVPADLNFASVEPVIRFVYSGRLEIQKSDSEMSAIYAAAKRLKVSLLTHVMDRHFPYLFPPSLESSAVQGDSEKHVKYKNLTTVQSSNSTVPLSKTSQEPVKWSGSKSGKDGSTSAAAVIANNQETNKGSLTDIDDSKRLEGCEEWDSSVYYLITNSRKYSHPNPAQCKKVTEEARPTRFELEEDSESSLLKIATWDAKCSSVPPPYPPVEPQVSTSNYCSSALVSYSSSETCSLTTSSPPQAIRKLSSLNQNVQKKQPHPPSHLTQQDQVTGPVESANRGIDLVNSLGVRSKCPEHGGVCDTKVDCQAKENDCGKENAELMETISSICKQLEEKESDIVNEDVFREKKSDEKLCSPIVDNKLCEEITLKNTASEATMPIKSILKKSKNRIIVDRETKHVSFPLDENNELINEVATFSLSKEPAQSLIEVQKMTGNLKSRGSTYSPVKLTVSMKKKVLMNLSLSESETIGSSSLQVKKSQCKKSISTSSQGHNKNQVSKGDITNHAKIISEVLKKYPHLVKDKRKIRLKILKKGNEKEGGGKVKSRVQYLVVSDGDSKSKPITKTYRTSSLSKCNVNVPQRVQNQPTFVCSECNNVTFQTYFMLKKHVSAEHKDKSSAILSRIENVPYACYTCFVNEPLEFGNYYSYQQHMKDVHSKTELRLCNICGFRPGRKLELAYHQYTEHNKVSRSFCFPKCDLCDHVAINDAALLKHRSQHTNADNYTCSVCGVKFCSFGALQGHMQTKLCQTKPTVSHKCPHCPLTFARSYNLKAHCKSSHKSLQASVKAVSGVEEKQSQGLMSQGAELPSEDAERGNNIIIAKSNSNYENNAHTKVECETLIDVTSQSSSEAEALSTVASSLAASLGLPEETVSHCMYPPDDKMEYSNTMDGEKIEQVASQPVSIAMHIEVPSVSEYQDHPQCYDKTYSVQTPVQDSTTVSALFPINVMSSEVLPNNIVSGQILPSHILQGGCTNSPSGPVLGAVPNSWAYVTYQVPTTSDDLPLVLTDSTSMNDPSVNPDESTSAENVYQNIANSGTAEEVGMAPSNVRPTDTATSMCENLVLPVTDAQTHVNISLASSLPMTHS